MKAVIHQPQYFPYPGFFHKLSLADVYIIMDNTQYDKRFTNRNKIIIPDGFVWLSIPINKEHKFLPNNVVEINNELPWQSEHWKKIQHSYGKSKFFNLYKDDLNKIYSKYWKYLFELNFETLKLTLKWLGLKIEIIKESELNLTEGSTQKLINGCKSVNADTYISGAGIEGKPYMNEDLFAENNINLVYQNYQSIVYPQQLSKTFVPDLSILDLLFNTGPESLGYITGTTK